MADPFLSEIRPISWNYPPRYHAFCNGTMMAISQNQALFSLLGTTYGGDGVRTFQLPDLRGAVAIGQGNGPNGVYTLGQTGGEPVHTLTAAETPSHTHTFNLGKADGTTAQPSTDGYVAAYGNGFLTKKTDTPLVKLEPTTIGSSGGSLPHENRQPYLCVNFIIALSGIFPSRN